MKIWTLNKISDLFAKMLGKDTGSYSMKYVKKLKFGQALNSNTSRRESLFSFVLNYIGRQTRHRTGIIPCDMWVYVLCRSGNVNS